MVDMYDCIQCSHRTASFFQLNHHIQRKHKNVYAIKFDTVVEPKHFFCICCGFKTYYQYELHEHIRQTHKPKAENDEHVISLVSGNFGGYRCDKCTCESDSSLIFIKYHVSCEEALQTLPQDASEKARGTESPDLNRTGLVKHAEVLKLNNMSRLHLNKKIVMLKCNQCSYHCKRNSNLERHVVLCHAAKDEIDWFQCGHCSHRSEKKSDLRRHIASLHATDEGINWFVCDKCSYRTEQKSCLKSHMLNHVPDEEIEWFHCNHCSYRGKRKLHLRRHMLRLHTPKDQIDWFQCSHCSYRDCEKSNLKRHVKSKHDINGTINWFKCKQCSYYGKRKELLQNHVLRRHTATDGIAIGSSASAIVRTESTKNVI